MTGDDPSDRRRLRVLELFCGIGGVAAALAKPFQHGLLGPHRRGGEGDLGTDPTHTAKIVEAVDLDRLALSVYRANFPHPVAVRNLAGARPDTLPEADLWALAPPCQPHTHRGRQRDIDDPRSAALNRLTEILPAVRPRFLFLENVPGFQESQAHARLTAALEGYHLRTSLLCPTDLGWPNRRRRFYLVASRDEPLRESAPPPPAPRLLDLVDPSRHEDPELRVSPNLARRYEGALAIVDAEDPRAVTTCFTSAYGRSPVRSGSYLRLPERDLGAGLGGTLDAGLDTGLGARRGTGPDGGLGNAPGPRLRRFHPREILALLGFPASYRVPDLPLANAWRLTGNSLSLPAVRHILSTLPG